MAAPFCCRSRARWWKEPFRGSSPWRCMPETRRNPSSQLRQQPKKRFSTIRELKASQEGRRFASLVAEFARYGDLLPPPPHAEASMEPARADPKEKPQECAPFAGSLVVRHCTEHGDPRLLLALYHAMEEQDHLSIDEHAFSMLLGACVRAEDLQTGVQLEEAMSERGFVEGGNSILGRNLMRMYARCGSLEKAHDVFDRLQIRDVVTWTVLIASYVEHGHGAEALSFAQEMQHEGVSPDHIAFVCRLKACSVSRSVHEGRGLHASITKAGLNDRPVVGNALLGMYLKCGRLLDGEAVFASLSPKNVVSWNSLICGYVEHGRDQEALECFDRMHQQQQPEIVAADVVTIATCLKACANLRLPEMARSVHSDAVRKGLEEELRVANALIDAYVGCGLMTTAQQTLGKLRARDVVSWNALISGYAEHGCDSKAMECIELMKADGVSPDEVTLACNVKACGKLGHRKKGLEVHAEIVKRGLDRETSIGNMLIDQYARCGVLTEARAVLEKLQRRNVVSWNTLITGYVEQGNRCNRGVLDCLRGMRCDAIAPNDITLLCGVKSCASIGDARVGRDLHGEITKKGYESELWIANALIDMYSKCGLLAAAGGVFEAMADRDVVSWNAQIAGYVEHGWNSKALESLRRMKEEEEDGGGADRVTIVCALKACGAEGMLSHGRGIHAEAATKGVEMDPIVGNIVVDMYAKCCALDEAQNVFDSQFSARSLASWNALITGYAQLGGAEQVLSMLEKMAMAPNEVSFVGLLNACSHAGLVDEGYSCFAAMIGKHHCIVPTLEHYTCMADLLGRAGLVDPAVVVIERMPFQPSLIACHALLGSCRKWGGVELGRQALRHIVQLDEKDLASYACLSNIYVDDSRNRILPKSTVHL